MISRRALLLAAATAFAGCSGGGGGPPPAAAPEPAPAIGSTVLGGGSDGLAVELLLAGDAPAWHADQRPIADPTAAAAADAIALDHARSTVLGAGAGPALVGSSLVRRLAAAPGAPADGNQRSGNLDETLLAEAERILAFAAALTPGMESVPMLPWRARSAELTQAPAPELNSTWQTAALGGTAVDVEQLARFIELRVTTARRLLRDRRGARFGADADLGALGLLAMQQALAAEDALFSGMFTAGGALGALPDPRGYDPFAAPRWLPASLAVDLDPAVAGAPQGFSPLDGSSDLAALGSLLRAAVDLSELADPATVLPLPELFRNQPFSPPPSVPVPPSVSWTGQIRALLTFRCQQCHLHQTFGGFSISSYESMRMGGNKTRLFNLQFIVPGNAEASLLHQILTGPPAPFVQMPFVGVILREEVQLIDEWIDGGALKNPPAPPAPPRPGDDSAQVSFKNLVALHFDQHTGALHHRYAADGPSGVATALATGRALQGLAAFARRRPDEALLGRTATRYLNLAVGFAIARLVDGQGRSFDAVDVATGEPLRASAAGDPEPADLRAHAALTAGLFAAAEALPRHHVVQPVARRAAAHLLAAHRTGDLFANEPGAAPDFLTAATLGELLAALRLAAAAGVADAAEARSRLVARLRPVLAFSEWDRDGEVIGDGIPDTDGDGLPEPGAAGGAFGRLPLVVDRIDIDPTRPPADRAPTWSRHVRPLLLRKCAECHMNGNSRGDYRLDTARALATPGESLGQFPMLVPGDAEASFFFRKLASRQPQLGSQMPLQRTPLDDASVALVRRWIESGASAR